MVRTPLADHDTIKSLGSFQNFVEPVAPPTPFKPSVIDMNLRVAALEQDTNTSAYMAKSRVHDPGSLFGEKEPFAEDFSQQALN